MSKRNEPCPCGSGRKYKQCCLAVVPNTMARRKEDHFPSKFKETWDMEQRNGEQERIEQLPTITIHWEEGVQNVNMKFDPKQFRTWEFVIAVLDMAKRKAEEAMKMVQMANMQRAMMEAQQAQQVAQQLGNKSLFRG